MTRFLTFLAARVLAAAHLCAADDPGWIRRANTTLATADISASQGGFLPILCRPHPFPKSLKNI